tara:strand:- start:17303 stop:17551 length:249 start_codon:yes stop_codon:yes gene_type:complete
MAKAKKVGPARRSGGPLASLWTLIVWLAGVLVSLAVGFGMVDGTLNVEQLFIPVSVTQVVGWFVVILAILGVVLKIIDSISN